MDENTANEANIEELGRHISRIGARLRAKATNGYDQGLEDLEAYYERTVQLRQYTIDTLRDEVKEARHRLSRFRTLVLVAVGTAILTSGLFVLLHYNVPV